MEPGHPIDAGEILIVEHFHEARIIATGTSLNMKFGGARVGALAAGEFSTLDSDGRLPQNKIGRLSGVMLRWVQYAAHANEAAGVLGSQLQDEINAMALVEILVGNVLISQHVMNALCAPPSIQHVGTTTAATAVHFAQNGGWPVAFGEHPLMERQSLQVNVRTLADVSGTIAASKYKLVCTWQVKTATETVSRAG